MLACLSVVFGRGWPPTHPFAMNPGEGRRGISGPPADTQQAAALPVLPLISTDPTPPQEILVEGSGEEARAVGVRLADGRVYRWGLPDC